jgi:hypothetical protein
MSRTHRLLALAGAAPLVVAPLALAGTAYAGTPSQSGGSQTFMTNVSPLNGSNVSGTLKITLNGDQAQLTEHLTGVKPTGAMAPHAQHLHFSTKANGPFAPLIGGGGPVEHQCPTSAMANPKNSADKDPKIISSVDARKAYGTPLVSMTTKGDYSYKSALAAKRFPTADSNGTIDYNRTIQLNSKQMKALKAGEMVLATHGIDPNGNGKYDTSGTKTGAAPLAAQAAKAGLIPKSMAPKIPFSLTAPNGCGVVKPVSQTNGVPQGSAATGRGSTSGIEDGGLLALGGGFLAAAAGAMGLRRRRSRVTS